MKKAMKAEISSAEEAHQHHAIKRLWLFNRPAWRKYDNQNIFAMAYHSCRKLRLALKNDIYLARSRGKQEMALSGELIFIEEILSNIGARKYHMKKAA